MGLECFRLLQLSRLCYVAFVGCLRLFYVFLVVVFEWSKVVLGCSGWFYAVSVLFFFRFRLL